MKKFILTLFISILTLNASYAAVQLKVQALDEFKTDTPKKSIKVKVLKDTSLAKYNLHENDILDCSILKVVDPKRGKRNATFFVQPISYTSNGETFNITEEMYGKYSKTVLSKEELKKIPPSSIAKNAVLMVGNHFVKGLSLGVSLVQGVVKNEKNNRLKSGVTKVYEDSPLSYISEGEQLDIKPEDSFYLVFKIADEEDEPNYTYTEPEETETSENAEVK